MNDVEFKKLKKKLQDNFVEMTKDITHLFEVNADKDILWNLYLDSFPAGTNEIYRERREYDCSCCRHFIKNIGTAVVIKNNEVKTIWGFNFGDTTFQPVIDAMDNYIKNCIVNNVYINKFKHIGTDVNREITDSGEILNWEHFYLELPERLVYKGSKSIGDIQGEFRDIRNVFKRSLDEITEDSVATVLELIASNSLYRGEEWKNVLNRFLEYKKRYDKLTSDKEKELFAWEKSIEAGAVIGKIRNHSIGTLLMDISDDVDLDTAVHSYERIVAPSNYKRPKAIFTKKMLEDAKKTIGELGYMESLGRRFATLDDITVNNILFINRDAGKRVKGVDIFDDMAKEIAINPKKYSKVEEIGIDDFVKNVLPNTKEIEALIENRHTTNLMSLIAPKDKDSKTMFKWNNNFGWAYTGNVTDSMKERVKAAGGKVDGVLRFSIQWNEDGKDNYDLDAHCYEPNGDEIYFGRFKKPYRSMLGGQLDVDIVRPNQNIAVENITWPDKSEMMPGVYKFFVHQFSGANKNGFRAEIEFDGQIYEFDYSSNMRSGQRVGVAEVTLRKDGTFTIKECLSSSKSSKEVWGVNTNQFVPVSTIMYSPNYWDGQDGIGHRHYFFMLKDCVNPEEPNGFYNEFLKQDLVQHKRVFEALGGKMAVEYVDDQLSGLGFSSTKRNELTVKVKGQTERVMKIKF